MSSDADVVISVRNVSKCFEMYEKPVHRLYQTLCAGRKKFYKEFWALRDVNFEVRKGECVGIIGRNGAGKSTLLQIITGTLAPTTGEVKLKGRVAALLELGSGFNPEFTGRENIYLNASILGLSHEETDARLQAILDFAGIGEFIDQPVKTYSSGMAVRLAFAVIAHVDADILIVDEALSVGDAVFQQKCMRFMRKFMKNRTVLFVSHDTAAVTNFCQRGMLLEQGSARMFGDAKSVVQLYLREIYAETQDVSGGSDAHAQIPLDPRVEETPYHDMRRDIINASVLRNDLEVFAFKSDGESFGDGKAAVASARICNLKGEPLSWIVGGEMVRLQIVCRAFDVLDAPIVGFIVRNARGENLFGDNTCIAYEGRPLHVDRGGLFEAGFEFQMPYLPIGDYSVCVAVAEGTQDRHAQHQWLNEALLFRSHGRQRTMGIVGIPIRRIEMHLIQ